MLSYACTPASAEHNNVAVTTIYYTGMYTLTVTVYNLCHALHNKFDHASLPWSEITSMTDSHMHSSYVAQQWESSMRYAWLTAAFSYDQETQII